MTLRLTYNIAEAVLKLPHSLPPTSDENELGKINALLSAIDSLMPAGISQIYASLWKVSILYLYNLSFLLQLFQ